MLKQPAMDANHRLILAWVMCCSAVKPIVAINSIMLSGRGFGKS